VSGWVFRSPKEIGIVRLTNDFFAALAFVAITVAGVASGCGSSNNNGGGLGPGPSDTYSGSSGGNGGSSGTSSGFSGSSGSTGMFSDPSSGVDASLPACGAGGTGWKGCVAKCSGSPTTISGQVFDPAGKNPLYNAIVFVPNIVQNLPTITPGTNKCDTCDASIGDYVVATLTDADGKFSLKGVPTGDNVPVTVQMGKWRRTVTVTTTTCQTTNVPAGTVRLPRNKSEGDMPQMALLTGGCDDMGCFLTGIGIDPSEFTGPQGGGRVDVYQGQSLLNGSVGPALSNGTPGNCTTSSCPLWQSKQSFEYYDIALLSCECAEHAETKPTSAITALDGWLNEGGKVFASHYHYYWFYGNPDPSFVSVANWNAGSTLATGAGTYDVNNLSTFPKGVIFGEWLGNVGGLASTGTPDTITAQFVATSVWNVNPATTQQWIWDPNGKSDAGANATKYLSFDTPIGGVAPSGDAAAESTGKQYCGKAVFTDLHTGGFLTAQYTPIPAKCPTNATLSTQQKALEFLFFDLSACVTDDSQPPPPIPLPPQ
jgi:hypothetical protein